MNCNFFFTEPCDANTYIHIVLASSYNNDIIFLGEFIFSAFSAKRNVRVECAVNP